VRLLRPLPGEVRRLALVPAAYHPPTRAHEALLRSALAHVDAALAVLPETFPHKAYERVPFDARLELLSALVEAEPRASCATCEGGLFIEMAREARLAVPGAEIWIVCGRDAAERIVNWRYDAHPSIEAQLDEFGLLVAPRQGLYVPPPGLERRIRGLEIGEEFQRMSSTDLRERIARGEPWAHLAPERLRDRIARLYS
jgi:nicotinic acid mononucleotide adenylyltransferase